MRSPAPSSRPRQQGRGALAAMVAASGAVLALALVGVLLGLAEPVSAARSGEGLRAVCEVASAGERSGQPPVCVQPWAFTAEGWAGAVRGVPAFQSHPQGLLGQGRAGFQPGLKAVQRAARERLEALVTARARMMRAPAMPVSAGYRADRPPLVTRPPRGPPARG